MADTTFVSKVTKIATAWLQDVNDLVYLKPGTILDNLWGWIQTKLASPGAIGGTTPAAITGTTITGTTITATGVVTAAAATAAGNVPRADQIQAQSLKYAVTGGTLTAYTLTLAPAMAAQADGAEVDVKFHTAAGTTPTLAVNGMAARPLKYYDSAGALQAVTATQVPTNWRSPCVTDGTNWIVRNVPQISLVDFNVSGSAPVYACRAWVRFNASSGTPSINAAGNVTSITDVGVGLFTVNMTIALPDEHYCVAITSEAPLDYISAALVPTASAFRIGFQNAAGVPYDPTYACVSVIR